MNEEYVSKIIRKGLNKYFELDENKGHFEQNPDQKDFLSKQVTTVAKFIADSGCDIKEQGYSNGRYWIKLCYKGTKKECQEYDGIIYFFWGKMVTINLYGKRINSKDLNICIDEEGIHGSLGTIKKERLSFDNQFLYGSDLGIVDFTSLLLHRNKNKAYIAGVDEYIKNHYPEVFTPKLKLTPNKQPLNKK